jgi:hypothetical protein
MSKKRYINTKFWDDTYIVSLDPTEKLLFIYLLTNPLTDICGIYEIDLRRMSFDTGIEREMILNIISRFEQEDKIYYFDNWIFIKNFKKHQAVNPSVEKGIERSLKDVPKHIMSKIKQISTDCGRLPTECSLLKPKPIPKPILKPILKPIDREETPTKKMKKLIELEEEQKRVISGLEEKGVPLDIAISEVKKFLSYWTEPNKSGTKQRWEMQSTFEVSRRLATWFGNYDKFNKTNKSKITFIS